jgi:hypothetical protein
VLNHQEKRKKKKTRQGSSSNHFQLVPVDEFRPSSMFFFFFFFSLSAGRVERERNVKESTVAAAGTFGAVARTVAVLHFQLRLP